MSVLAFDLGASGGKVLSGELVDGKLVTLEIHRFANEPVQVGKHLYWDILRLFHEIKQGLLKAKWQGVNDIASMGIDTWGVDYGLIGSNGQLLSNPIHYRDPYTAGMMEKVRDIVPDQEMFGRVGIQFMSINTIYQLVAMSQDPHSPIHQADSLLMIPDLLRYFLTGEKTNEFTIASTSQLVNAKTMDWDWKLIAKLGLNEQLFRDIVQPATVAGRLTKAISEELSIEQIPVVAVGEHDTASAVVATPATDEYFAYLSCGTWSLIGTEMSQPVLTERARELNFTNEGGIGRSYRMLKNIMGLWLLQECKRVWERAGQSFTYPELIAAAERTSAFHSFVDPDDEMFLNPADMPAQIQHYCRQTNQPIPEQPGEFVRCIIESLALKYRYALELIEELADRQFNGLHMVGGGIQNELLCQFTANALSRQVWAGPIEASAIGNMMTQYIALGKVATLAEARQIVATSFPMQTYQPQHIDEWKEAYERFRQVIRY